MNDLRLYLRMVGIAIRGSMQYRASFLMMSLGQLGVTAIEFFGIWALFDRFGRLPGWQLAEVAVFYGVVNVAFAFADTLSRGFDLFGEDLKQGEFDRLLVRPRSPLLQLSGRRFAIHRVGRFAQGLAVLAFGLHALDITLGPAQIGLLLLTLAGGTALFLGLVILQATLAFFSTESLEVMNTMTYGGVQTAQYPLAIYRESFRRFFTFVVPLAGVAYFPVLALMGRSDPLGSTLWMQALAPLSGFAFLALACGAFALGTRRYTSAGS
ncbi:MAG: ABC-2 family transporter protein [Myxococcota bacterium]|nr:ABC-2 family transporter protein [Myxococcota bacterium]